MVLFPDLREKFIMYVIWLKQNSFIASTPDQTGPHQTRPHHIHTTLQYTTPHHNTPHHITSHHTTLHYTTLHHTPHHATPPHPTPHKTTQHNTTKHNKTHHATHLYTLTLKSVPKQAPLLTSDNFIFCCLQDANLRWHGLLYVWPSLPHTGLDCPLHVKSQEQDA